MSKEVVEQVAAVARQLEEHLKFYREMGVADIGGSSRAAKQAQEADFEAESAREDEPALAQSAEPGPLAPEPEIIEQRVEAMPKKTEPTGQESLFAGLFPELQQEAKSASLPVIQPQDGSLEAIREDIGECTRCKLHLHRTNIVFGEGSPEAELVFIGEGPGADEDATGRPFVGRAGQLLDKIIAAIGLKREQCYIANVVKCRPPGNRTPERDETATCEQFLFRQLALIRPKVIVALGSPAFQCLLRTKDTISKSRGQWREWNGVKVMPTFHPAYLLRTPEKKREVWDDMKKVRDYLNSLTD